MKLLRSFSKEHDDFFDCFNSLANILIIYYSFILFIIDKVSNLLLRSLGTSSRK